MPEGPSKMHGASAAGIEQVQYRHAFGSATFRGAVGCRNSKLETRNSKLETRKENQEQEQKNRLRGGVMDQVAPSNFPRHNSHNKGNEIPYRFASLHFRITLVTFRAVPLVLR